MTKDFFMIDIPIFAPKYEKEKQYGWTKHKDELWDLLKDTSGGYCMYCYDSIWINRQRRGQIEHGIEKANCIEILEDCVPNLGLACENCNIKYKRHGESKRKLNEEEIESFKSVSCKKFDCKKACEAYKKLRIQYVKNGKIIIQPFETRLYKTGKVLRIQYDLLKGEYVPSRLMGKYTQEEISVIKGHIDLFKLNSPERKNYEVGRYCKNVIDNCSLMKDGLYNNLIVDIFREKLQSLDIEEAVKVCKVVYNSAFYGLAT